jgi:hypothetical protein
MRPRYHLIAAGVVGVVSAAAIYGLDRGIFIGSETHESAGFLIKRCRYLFVTGIADMPARGGSLERVGMGKGTQLAELPDGLFCRLFGD